MSNDLKNFWFIISADDVTTTDRKVLIKSTDWEKANEEFDKFYPDAIVAKRFED